MMLTVMFPKARIFNIYPGASFFRLVSGLLAKKNLLGQKHAFLLLFFCVHSFAMAFATPVCGDVLLLSQPDRQVSGILVEQTPERVVFDVRDLKNQVNRQEFRSADVRKLIRTIDPLILNDVENRSSEELFEFAENLVSLAGDQEAYFQAQRILNVLLQRSDVEPGLREAVERLKLVSIGQGLERSRLLRQWIESGRPLPASIGSSEPILWRIQAISPKDRTQIRDILRASRTAQVQVEFVLQAIVVLREQHINESSVVVLCDQLIQWCESADANSIDLGVRLLRMEIFLDRPVEVRRLPLDQLPVNRMWPDR